MGLMVGLGNSGLWVRYASDKRGGRRRPWRLLDRDGQPMIEVPVWYTWSSSPLHLMAIAIATAYIMLIARPSFYATKSVSESRNKGYVIGSTNILYCQ